MTHTITAMLDTHPGEPVADKQALAECIDACLRCAQTCTACADACLSEDMVADLRACIRLNADCADICSTTASVLSRQTGGDATVVTAIVQACAAACRACGDECGTHAEMHEHCRVCAEACRACEEACNRLLAALA
ncbi:four-helix bundle copper-binding protein [Nocardioides ferulae]|uniref:four-helix bundle copper-binding protein n=1 Tax=Nocardioides ferulae TaxID=2340821 RepID=UPI000EB298E6|nr:four-helix bundle copper-binding protein [Nocardioides ferulae]